MKTTILLIVQLLFLADLSAQEVLGSAGRTEVADGLIISHTVGETVIGTVENGVTAYQGFHNAQITITAIEPADAFNALEVYPNPTPGLVTITSERTIGPITLHDVKGTCVLEYASSTNSTHVALDLSFLRAGQYILTVHSNAGAVSYQLVKE